jgi:hypothetical protein
MTYKTEYEEVLQELANTKKALKKLPKGQLSIRKDGKSGKWFADDGHRKEFISRKNRSYASQLAMKTYLSLKLERLSEEKEAWEIILQDTKIEETLLAHDSLYRDLLLSQVHCVDEYSEWENAPFESNPYHPEQLKIQTVSKYCVRSKSESIIANELFSRNIPFRYECGLSLDQKIIYPDFTLIRPWDGRKLYWEHFGLVENKDYRDHFMNKLDDYMESGIFPGDRLIMTFETAGKPLDLSSVRCTMGLYML